MSFPTTYAEPIDNYPTERVPIFTWNNRDMLVNGNLASLMNCTELEINGLFEKPGNVIRWPFQFYLNEKKYQCYLVIGASKFNIEVKSANKVILDDPQLGPPGVSVQVNTEDTYGLITFQLLVTQTIFNGRPGFTRTSHVDVKFTATHAQFVGNYYINNIIGYEDIRPTLVKKRLGYTVSTEFAREYGTLEYKQMKNKLKFEQTTAPRKATFVQLQMAPEDRVVKRDSPFAAVETYMEGNTVVYGRRDIKNTVRMEEDEPTVSDCETSPDCMIVE